MKRSRIINDGIEVINTELKGIRKLNKTIDKNFDKAVKALAKVKGRVIITGVGKSGHIASKISSTMSSTGTPSQYCSPTDMSHGDLGVISNKDAIGLPLYSASGAWAASLITLTPYFFEIFLISSYSHGRPYKGTTIIALVLLVILFSKSFGSILNV